MPATTLSPRPVAGPSSDAAGVSGPDPEPVVRVVDATLRCIARWGVAKTTLDDVAREAACSRATVYRLFPGGKEGLLVAVVRVELGRFFAGLAGRLEAADTLEDLLVAGMSEAGLRLAGHAPLQFLLAHELEAILPHVAFARKNDVLRLGTAFGATYVERWLPAEEATRAAEWVTRVVLSYSSCPADGVDLADEESVRRLVRTFVLPGLRPLAGSAIDSVDASGRPISNGG